MRSNERNRSHQIIKRHIRAKQKSSNHKFNFVDNSNNGTAEQITIDQIAPNSPTHWYDAHHVMVQEDLEKKEREKKKKKLKELGNLEVRKAKYLAWTKHACLFVSWCFKPSQPQGITSGLD